MSSEWMDRWITKLKSDKHDESLRSAVTYLHSLGKWEAGGEQMKR